MKKIHFLMLFIWLFSCHRSEIEKPIWVNPVKEWKESDGLMKFKVVPGDWSAIIQTSSHPIPADFSLENDELWVAFPKERLFVSGQAFLVLYLERNSFSFPFFLSLDLKEGKLEDIRSPKTLNTDSSLVQQQMLYAVGKGGNLVPLDNEVFFKEQYIHQGEKVGIFSGASDTNLSSFYITAGTPETLPISAQFEAVQNLFIVQVGPLKDAFQNYVPNGTLVTFSVRTDSKIWIIEEVVKDGFAYIHLSEDRFTAAGIQANVAHVFSKNLDLLKP
ncbi:hypothetical protein ACFOUP_18295 [Belliella kenyensis]|uniref:Uncharacterized protein n=1 Tax=Belliella kenyensis TaxID=1472724 RepID=A0ABV8EQK8_9BACT|nr:hypothetical protein [Belliella kenyensis]MCH7402269.1 hypothetical protein [Belliella kenyensis]MDN3601785.1 hypothetical protein [Belliella kenyensis]